MRKPQSNKSKSAEATTNTEGTGDLEALMMLAYAQLNTHEFEAALANAPKVHQVNLTAIHSRIWWPLAFTK